MAETNPTNSNDISLSKPEPTQINLFKNQKTLPNKITSKDIVKIIRKNKNIVIIIISVIILLIILLNINNISKLFKKKKKPIEEIVVVDKKPVKKNFKIFFEENLDELEYCDNYGLMIYDNYYTGVIHKPNIGDYIQSLAALQFLPKNCKPYFIDRDIVQFYHGPKVKLIMNSWQVIHEGNKYISDDIIPIFVSYHLNSNFELPQVYIDALKKYSPIGCRDTKTRNQFIKYGIDSYFSSCLTTTLDMEYAVNDSKRNNDIIFIDYNYGDYPQADKFLRSLKAYNLSESNIKHTRHKFNNDLSHIERFKMAKQLLNRYARAKLIVSTRIHGALPSLALRTPVIFIKNEYDHNRFPGLYELLNTVGPNEKGKFEVRVNIDEKGLVYNSNKYLEYANKMKERLKHI